MKIEAQEQYSLIGTIFNYIFDFGPPGKYLDLSPPEIHYPSAGEAGRGIIDFLDFSIDISLEVQNKKYNQILYLLDYIAPGHQFQYKSKLSSKIAQNL